MLDSLRKDLEVDHLAGLLLQEGVATFVKSAFAKPLSGESLKTKTEKYAIPSNVDCLTTHKVNEAVWTKLSTDSRAGHLERDREDKHWIHRLAMVVPKGLNLMD